MKTESIFLMLSDVTHELLEKAKLARQEAQRSNSDYERGRHFALYEIVSLLSQQAAAFGIDKSMIGLENVDVERDLLSS